MNSDILDEIEALKSVYYEGDLEITPSRVSDEENIIISKSCFPHCIENPEKYFVEVKLKVIVSSRYLVNPPVSTCLVSLLKSSGLVDDGKRLLKEIDSFLKSAQANEPILITLFEFVSDYLDSNNMAVCLICYEKLDQFSQIMGAYNITFFYLKL